MLVVGLAACGGPLPLVPAGEPAPSGTALATSPAVTSEPSAPGTSAPSSQTPLVLAVHASRPGLDVSVEVARRLVAGEVADWAELGAPSAPLRLVASPAVEDVPADLQVGSSTEALQAAQGDLGVVALVPATVVGPTVRALRVGGVDPMASPASYPIQTPGPPPGRVVTLAFVGDLMLARGVGRVIETAGDPAAPLRPTAGRLAAADVTVGTLESTLSRLGRPTQGGDSFGADPTVREGLTLAGFDVLSLAANHLGDYGSDSIVETVRLVRETDIVPVGGGADLAEAEAPAVVERNGTTIGVLAFNAIGETPRAEPGAPGALELRMGSRTGPLDAGDLAAMEARVRALAERVDVVVVMPHWGTQYTNQPEEDQRTVAAALAAAGADLVIGGHPHWVQGVEVVGGAFVAHSLGNYVFDMDFMEQTMEGAILDVVLWDDAVKAATFSAVRMDAAFTPRELPPAEADTVLDLVWSASPPPFARP